MTHVGAATDGTPDFLGQGQPRISHWISEPDPGLHVYQLPIPRVTFVNRE